MKIYRAVVMFNNGNSLGWERWYTKASVWYIKRELAEKHLPKFKEFLNCLKTEAGKSFYTSIQFKSTKPYIEVEDVNEKYNPMEIDTETV